MGIFFFPSPNFNYYCSVLENKRLSLNNHSVENEDVKMCIHYSFIHSFRIADSHSLMKRNGACSKAVYILSNPFGVESIHIFFMSDQQSTMCLNVQPKCESANVLPQNLTVSLFLFEKINGQKPQIFFLQFHWQVKTMKAYIYCFCFSGCCGRCYCRCWYLSFCYWLRWFLCLYLRHSNLSLNSLF